MSIKSCIVDNKDMTTWGLPESAIARLGRGESFGYCLFT